MIDSIKCEMCGAREAVDAFTALNRNDWRCAHAQSDRKNSQARSVLLCPKCSVEHQGKHFLKLDDGTIEAAFINSVTA